VAATLSGCIDETKNMTISFVNGPVKNVLKLVKKTVAPISAIALSPMKRFGDK